MRQGTLHGVEYRVDVDLFRAHSCFCRGCLLNFVSSLQSYQCLRLKFLVLKLLLVVSAELLGGMEGTTQKRMLQNTSIQTVTKLFRVIEKGRT